MVQSYLKQCPTHMVNLGFFFKLGVVIIEMTKLARVFIRGLWYTPVSIMCHEADGLLQILQELVYEAHRLRTELGLTLQVPIVQS